MLARVQSYLLQGIDAHPCEVEIDNDPMAFKEEGAPQATVVGLPDASVKESISRVRSALGNSGFFFPTGRTLINLAPADVKKEGPVYDLPIAVGLLMVQGIIGGRSKSAHTAKNGAALKVEVKAGRTPTPAALSATPRSPALHSPASPDSITSADPDPRHYLFAGELALDGRLRPVRGVLALAALAKSRGYRGVIVPAENAAEASVVPGIESIGVRTLAEVVGLLTGLVDMQPHPPLDIEHALSTSNATVDFVDVRGQEAVKRAIVISAAGAHNLLRLCPSDRHGGMIEDWGLAA